jgi:choline dehydrogenase
VWEYPDSPDLVAPRNNTAEATFFWKSGQDIDAPDVQTTLTEISVCSPAIADQYGVPTAGFTMCAGLVRPRSRGQIKLTGPDPLDPVQIEANMLTEPEDVQAAIAAAEISREIANSDVLRPYVKREVMPETLSGNELERFVRNAAMSYSHETCTAKMGRDSMSVVDGKLKVYGLEGVRIADGSIMPRVTTGNTMAPCVVIGERAAEILVSEHAL